jgi:hypothetical protein
LWCVTIATRHKIFHSTCLFLFFATQSISPMFASHIVPFIPNGRLHRPHSFSLLGCAVCLLQFRISRSRRICWRPINHRAVLWRRIWSDTRIGCPGPKRWCSGRATSSATSGTGSTESGPPRVVLDGPPMVLLLFGRNVSLFF